MSKNNTRTELSSVGEFKLIELLSEGVVLNHKETIKGIGDDAAVFKSGEEYILSTTDLLIEGIHFDLSYVPLQHLGYKAVAVNVSDIAAMNGTPKQITVGLALSNRFSLEAVEQLYQGVYKACENYKVDLVGGDTTASPKGLMLAVQAMGTTRSKDIVYRSGAKENDLICVSGDLGGAYIGLQILEREKQVFLSNPGMQPELSGNDYVIKRQLKPEARMDIIHELKELQLIPSAMIDLSDGIASDLMHLCKASDVGAVLFEDKIPIHDLTYELASKTFKISPTTCALNGGEDYELLFTIPQEDYEKIKKHYDISAIGYIAHKNKGCQLVTRSGTTVAMKAQGWQHF